MTGDKESIQTLCSVTLSEHCSLVRGDKLTPSYEGTPHNRSAYRTPQGGYIRTPPECRAPRSWDTALNVFKEYIEVRPAPFPPSGGGEGSRTPGGEGRGSRRALLHWIRWCAERPFLGLFALCKQIPVRALSTLFLKSIFKNKGPVFRTEHRKRFFRNNSVSQDSVCSVLARSCSLSPFSVRRGATPRLSLLNGNDG